MWLSYFLTKMKREIEPELFRYFEDKLRENLEATFAINNNQPRILFRLALEACNGIREKTNNNDGKLVELFQKTVGDAARESWCMSFVQSGLAYVETKLKVTSPIFASEHCLTVWNNTPKIQRALIAPATGAIMIWRHGSSTNGHTGVTRGEVYRMKVKTVEGNTSSGNSGDEIIREGGGVYFCERDMRGVGNMKYVGSLKPF